MVNPTESQLELAALAPSHDGHLSGGGDGWVIQVGAFADKANALKVMNHLTHSKQIAQIEEAQVAGAFLHRVVVGPYPSKGAAQRQLFDLLGSNSVDPHAFVRQNTM
jgi:hypothetical protein